MIATAATLTALVSTKISTERLAIRSTAKPRVRSTQAPSAMPGEAADRTTELTASSASDRREVSDRAERPEHEVEQHHVAGAGEQLEHDAAPSQPSSRR